ncbi:hypothetical protein MPSEU_000674000 [Mayamaea pseudoterrestris]|nr:hypothetical protein MPSEU_000674000 [Mayamaea pseudoterrestris]
MSTKHGHPQAPLQGADFLTNLVGRFMQSAMLLLILMDHYALQYEHRRGSCSCKEASGFLKTFFFVSHQEIDLGVDVTTHIEQVVDARDWEVWFSRMFRLHGPQIKPVKKEEVLKIDGKFLDDLLEFTAPASLLLLNLLHYYLLHQHVGDPCYVTVMFFLRAFFENSTLDDAIRALKVATALHGDGNWDTFYLKMHKIYAPGRQVRIISRTSTLSADALCHSSGRLQRQPLDSAGTQRIPDVALADSFTGV